MTGVIEVVLGCPRELEAKARYVFDTLLIAAGLRTDYRKEPSGNGPFVWYGDRAARPSATSAGISILHCSKAWDFLQRGAGPTDCTTVHGLPVPFGGSRATTESALDIEFDLVANAFYFLSSWQERALARSGARALFAESVFAREKIPQSIVDSYLALLLERLQTLPGLPGRGVSQRPIWAAGRRFAVVLSHDVDYLPTGLFDIVAQAGRTMARHLMRQKSVREAAAAFAGLVRALAIGRDPFGCVPHIILEEQRRGVRASFQVAVARRHPKDVNYSIDHPRIRDYLGIITRSGFELALHGSYRSTENDHWYGEEVATLTAALGAPIGSRQHYLAFDYDVLFSAQERAGIEYDMSLGYPDHPGSRVGFSYPFFPYNINEDRPYRVLQIPLVLMDVTLRSYMHLDARHAWDVMDQTLRGLQRQGGCASVVWHPIVFGNARDPGYGDLFWKMVDTINQRGGLATDGRTINRIWRRRASAYASFAFAERGPSSPASQQTMADERMEGCA
jgi:hypothetical protein